MVSRSVLGKIRGATGLAARLIGHCSARACATLTGDKAMSAKIEKYIATFFSPLFQLLFEIARAGMARGVRGTMTASPTHLIVAIEVAGCVGQHVYHLLDLVSLSAIGTRCGTVVIDLRIVYSDLHLLLQVVQMPLVCMRTAAILSNRAHCQFPTSL